MINNVQMTDEQMERFEELVSLGLTPGAVAAIDVYAGSIQERNPSWAVSLPHFTEDLARIVLLAGEGRDNIASLAAIRHLAVRALVSARDEIIREEILAARPVGDH